jgi:cytoskeletal protein RodZ
MTVGTQLQDARKARKLSVADVTAATKIQPWVVEAIEADRLHEAMSPIYVRGFISSYARFLQLNPAGLLAQLAEVAPPEPVPAPEAAEPPPAPAVKFELPKVSLPKVSLPPVSLPEFSMPRFSLPRMPRMPRLSMPVLKRLGTVAAVALVVAGLVALKPAERLSKISWPKLSLPQMAKSDAKKSDKKADAKKADKKAVTAKSAAKPAASPVQELSSAPKLATVAPIAEPASLPTPSPQALASTQALELRISAHKTTWIKVSADGKLLTQQRLSRGANERWTAKKQFELIISKPTQVDITLNGQPISPFAVAHKGRVLITHRGVTRLPEE